MIKISTFILCLLLTGFNASSQTTGSFNVNIPFLTAQRQLAMYVPTTYNAANKYKLMICLHGYGDNAVAYRDALANSRNWKTAYPQTIFVCPEARTVNNDFFQPAGDDAILQSSIDYAMANYHIDTADVVLQGFSLGGRAALRYGLDHPTKFKGLLLNTPAVQGVKEALNLSSLYNYNFSNAAGIPIYISLGATDIGLRGATDTAYERLLVNDAKVSYHIIPNMGHTLPGTSQMDFYGHFNDPGNAPYDVDVAKLEVVDRTCNATINPKATIRNSGKNALTSVKLHYTMGAASGDYLWSGNLAPYQHAVVSLPVLTATAGLNNLVVTVAELNGSMNDTYTANNEQARNINYVTSGTALPLHEGFESSAFPPANWLNHSAGDVYYEYYRDEDVKKTGNASFGAVNTIWIYDNASRHEDLLSPVIDLSSIATPKVSFDVAYRYHRFTAPYFTPDTNFADTLEVLLSTDCGLTYQSLYKKGGTQLSTFATPIMNPDVNSVFAEPADSNWRRESIDLMPYRTNSSAIVKFRYISALGGSLNVDNVSFSNSAVGVSHVSLPGMKMYPNPANNVVNITPGKDAIHRVELLDLSGRLVLEQVNVVRSGESFSIDVSTLSSGVYLLKAFGDNGIRVERISVSR